MNADDKERFAVLMYGMGDNFRDSITKEGLKFRFIALKEYSFAQIERAAMHIIRTRKFTKMPTIADFIEAIEGNQQDVAELQAHHVLSMVRECGAYNPPTFDDPITRELVSRRWRWEDLCSMHLRDIHWFVREFTLAYQTYQRSEMRLQLDGPEEVKVLASGMFAGPSRRSPSHGFGQRARSLLSRKKLVRMKTVKHRNF